jgi:hypothetical protein
MNWLLKLLGYRDRTYRGDGFSVRIEPISREVISIVYTRHGTTFNLGAERIGRKWEGIAVSIPDQEVGAEQVPQVVHNLERAFEGMGYGYVISRKTGVDVVSETERQAAIAELNEMGFEIEILPNRQIRQTRREGAPHQDREAIRKATPRIVSLIQSLHGTRQRYEILAKSKEF